MQTHGSSARQAPVAIWNPSAGARIDLKKNVAAAAMIAPPMISGNSSPAKTSNGGAKANVAQARSAASTPALIIDANSKMLRARAAATRLSAMSAPSRPRRR